MKVYRLCDENEVQDILSRHTLQDIGNLFKSDCKKNTHNYIDGKKYMHLFDDIYSVLFLNSNKGKYICVYDIPIDILDVNKGIGYYLDYVSFSKMINITEYAVESKNIKYNYLDKIYFITNDLDFDYYPDENEFYSCLTLKYDFEKQKQLKSILMDDDILNSINKNINKLLELIPEINGMIGFEHRHPHHHLDVWNHTLLALSKAKKDFEIRLVLLLHDIGKPYSFLDGEVRHFYNHAYVSSNMAKEILNRLQYSSQFINKICSLISNHDTPITNKQIKDYIDFCLKLYEIQRCDALAHNPYKLEKRLIYLDDIKRKIKVL